MLLPSCWRRLMRSRDELNGITYLDHVIEEVMRMRQPYQALERKCTRSCVVPLRYPVVGRDGHLIECVKVTKGDEVWIRECS